MLYRPTRAEKKRAQQLLDTLELSADAQRSYRTSVKRFWARFDQAGVLLSNIGEVVELEGLREKRSVLFGRGFLVGSVPKDWFDQGFPTSDAVMVPLGPLDGEDRPPLVLVRDHPPVPKDPQHLSIFEHEFVHVVQSLLGRLTLEPPPATSEGLLAVFLEQARAEYEANLLQLTHWPHLYPSHHGVSLEDWCTLRAHTGALEFTLLRAASEDATPAAVKGFLSALHQNLPQALAQVGMHSPYVKQLQARLPEHVAKARALVLMPSPHWAKHRVSRAAQRWAIGLLFPSAPT